MDLVASSVASPSDAPLTRVAAHPNRTLPSPMCMRTSNVHCAMHTPRHQSFKAHATQLFMSQTTIDLPTILPRARTYACRVSAACCFGNRLAQATQRDEGRRSECCSSLVLNIYWRGCRKHERPETPSFAMVLTRCLCATCGPCNAHQAAKRVRRSSCRPGG